jgi:hypothetical protein
MTQHSNRRGNKRPDTGNVHISDRQAFFTAEGNVYFANVITWTTPGGERLVIRPA